MSRSLARSRFRAIALAMVAVWALGPAAFLAHADAHAHTWCEQHGEFEESVTSNEASDSHDRRVSVGRDAASAQHEGCDVLGVLTRDATPAVSSITVWIKQPAPVVTHAGPRDE